MKNTFTALAATALLCGAIPNQSAAGDCHYVYNGDKTCNVEGSDCCFSYDYIDVAYMYSDYGSAPAPGVLTGAILNAPNATIVDQMKGVNIELRKSIGCNFYLAGEFYNTDGPLSDSVVRARQLLVGDNLLTGKRAEFYYYRVGVGYHHSLNGNIDLTIDGGGLYTDCEVPGKDQDEWGWYVSPGIRICIGGMGEIYANYMYESFETMENHRFDGGAIIPVADCLSLKLGGRYETEFEKTSFLAGIRFDY